MDIDIRVLSVRRMEINAVRAKSGNDQGEGSAAPSSRLLGETVAGVVAVVSEGSRAFVAGCQVDMVA